MHNGLRCSIVNNDVVCTIGVYNNSLRPGFVNDQKQGQYQKDFVRCMHCVWKIEIQHRWIYFAGGFVA